MVKLNNTNKSFVFKAETVTENGHFSGYANTWEVDLVNDRFMPGAFKKTIRDTRGKIPILKGHDSQIEIGMTLQLSEDNKGLKIDDARLYVDPDLKNEVVAAREEYVRMKARAELGRPMGISVGVTVPEGKAEYVKERGGWDIREARLWEASLTPFPANASSMVDAVKAVPSILEFADGAEIARANREFIDGLNTRADRLGKIAADVLGTSGDKEYEYMHNGSGWQKVRRAQ